MTEDYDPQTALRIYKNYKNIGTKANYPCENPDCRQLTLVDNLQIHHLIPIQVCPRYQYDPHNMMFLCPKCHDIVEHTEMEKLLQTEVDALLAQKGEAESRRRMLEKIILTKDSDLNKLKKTILTLHKTNPNISIHAISCCCCKEEIAMSRYVYNAGDIYCLKCFMANFGMDVFGNIAIKTGSALHKQIYSIKNQ